MLPSTEAELLSLPSDKQALFWSQYNAQQKSPGAALGLCLFLGGFGVHEFYLGNPVLGVVYALFCWTFIPVMAALIQCFSIMDRTKSMNNSIASRIVSNLKATQPMGRLQPSGTSTLDVVKDLNKLDNMLAAGVINDDEYQALRKKTLGL